ncbi:Cytochrome C oxidase, cbb3-type, subunit III [Rhodospirillales bacterium URHD0017]|nr:Cytochrome C oxidase, cbb3-type, subunit III [Rhodospirillales bacterium URHD0017]
MKLSAWALVISIIAMAGQPLRADERGDPERGLAVARQVCSECHAIQAQQLQSPQARAPTFLALATTPGMTATALSVALTTPHAGMPMFRLTAEQRDGIIAYILSLKQSGSPPGK